MLASVVTAVVFLLLQLLVPHRPKAVSSYTHVVASNRYKFVALEFFALVPVFLVIAAITYIFHLLALDVQQFLLQDRVTDFAIYPSDDFWLVIGLFFGFGLLIPPIDLLFHLLLRDAYSAYWEYTNRRHGYDGMRVLGMLCRACVAAGIVFTFLGFNWSVEVKGDYICFNDYFSLRTAAYPASSITSVTLYDKRRNANGIIEPEPHYKVVFQDGRVWNTHNSLNELSFDRYTAIIDHLLARSGITLNRAEIDNM